jgi:hypothetical protein
MVAAMAKFAGPVTGVAEIARMSGEAIEGWLREYEGYRGLVMLTDEEAGASRVITFWDSRKAEASARRARQSMREQIAASIGMEIVEFGVWDVPVYEMVPADAPA